MPDHRPQITDDFAKLCDIVAKLRAPAGCPWDREQTNESLLPALIEEAYETAEAARAQASNQASEQARAFGLLSKQAITSAEADRLRAAAETAAAQAAAAEARLVLARQGTRGELKRAAAAEVAGLAAELSESRLLLEQLEIRAPRDGVLLRRHAEVGEQVSPVPLSVVVSMANLDRLQVRAEISLSLLKPYLVKEWRKAFIGPASVGHSAQEQRS